MAVSKSLRFAVLQRDKFKCVYCGLKRKNAAYFYGVCWRMVSKAQEEAS